MIKKLQQLKAKKGFTLVELLVVIAIIGILAAILIPLMANYMRNARITSANATASSLQSALVGLMSAEQTANRGPAGTGDFNIYVQFGATRPSFTVAANGDRTLVNPPTVAVNTGLAGAPANPGTWTTTPTRYDDIIVTANDHTSLIRAAIANEFTDARNTTMYIAIRGGRVTGVAVLPRIAGAANDGFGEYITANGVVQNVEDGRHHTRRNDVVGTWPVATTQS